MDSDNLFLHLMKNPYKSKKKKVDCNICIDKLHIELIKKFSDYNINNDLYEIILKKIEILLSKYTIKTILYDIVEQIKNES